MTRLRRWKNRQRSRLIFTHVPVPGTTITARGLITTRRYHGVFVPDPKRGLF